MCLALKADLLSAPATLGAEPNVRYCTQYVLTYRIRCEWNGGRIIVAA